MPKSVQLILPHQLFKEISFEPSNGVVFLIEEYLFFNQYKFHKQKIAFHRATMKFYETYLQSKGFEVKYVEAKEENSDIRIWIEKMKADEVNEIHYIDPTDDWLSKRIQNRASSNGIKLMKYNSQLFIHSKENLNQFFKKDKKKFFQTEFYISERKRLGLLMDQDEKPHGGKWSFDQENRKKYPKSKTPPPTKSVDLTDFHEEAKRYVEENYEVNYGSLGYDYPINFHASEQWLNYFLEYKFHEFGTYEDAIVKDANFINHSVLTPMLNVGLLTPNQVIDEAVKYADQNEVPINSVEGFIRQIIGWREFIRGVYEVKGVEERTRNFWNFDKKIPSSFYDGTTGIVPIDQTIKKVLKTGYCHHIERLMILGNFMLLCEFDPDEVYKWFMELFIDAYDWVMVTNVYGMSQFADGGLMATKPYISGSNYIMKMSDYQKGKWQDTWDGLFWRFMDKQRDFFLSNPRIGMLVHTFDKMSNEKKEAHLRNAQSFLDNL